MATLADVSRRAGVSMTTVSRVLNNKMVMPISPSTIERIHEAARDLNYRPNPRALALATGRNQAIGLYSVAMTHPQFTQMLEAVERRAHELGYLVIVSSTLDVINDRGRVDGLLVLGLPTDPDFLGLAEIAEENRPLTVFVNRSTRVLPRTISWDDAEGIAQAVRYVMALGHRRIALLCGYSGKLEGFDPKAAGFRDALRETPGAEGRVFWSEGRPDWRNVADQFDNGAGLGRALLRDWPEATALIATNDHVAAGAVRGLRESGRDVPHDMSVVGYTDSTAAHCTTPALTSVRTPIAEAGVMALEWLVQAVGKEGEEMMAAQMLPTRLVCRDSCAPL